MKELHESELPELKGSDKQIAWAKDIRSLYLKLFNDGSSYDFPKRKSLYDPTYTEKDREMAKRRRDYARDLDNIRIIATLNNYYLKSSSFTGNSLHYYKKALDSAVAPEFSSNYESEIKTHFSRMKNSLFRYRAEQEELSDIIDKITDQMLKDWQHALGSVSENAKRMRRQKMAYRNFVFEYARKNLLENDDAAWWINHR